MSSDLFILKIAAGIGAMAVSALIIAVYKVVSGMAAKINLETKASKKGPRREECTIQ